MQLHQGPCWFRSSGITVVGPWARFHACISNLSTAYKIEVIDFLIYSLLNNKGNFTQILEFAPIMLLNLIPFSFMSASPQG